jgi:hypothetical protein
MWLGDEESVQGVGCSGPCMGADGNLYEWVEGIDGLGNPVGFWKRLRRGLRRVAPLAQMIPGGAATMSVARRAGLMGADEMTEVMGVGALGELAEGPDGNLYQWVQGVDGLGNPFGFWKRLRRGLKRVVKRAMPLAKMVAPYVPGGAAALTVATPFMRQAGIMGADDQVLQGLEGDDELQGLSEEELQGLEADDEIQGTDGYLRQDTVSGMGAFMDAASPPTPEFRGHGSPMWTPLW